MTSRERVLNTVNRRKADRIPIDLGGLKASGIAASAYHRVKQQLGIQTPTRVADARFMVAEVEDAVRKRLHVDVIPLDWAMAFNAVQPDRAWSKRNLFDGTPVLIPPDTRIGEDAEGNWVLLKPDGTPTSFRMPRNGYYFDDCSFDESGGIDPAKFTPVTDLPDEQLAQFGLCHAGVGVRRLFSGDEPDYQPWGQRHAGEAQRVDGHADDRKRDLPRNDEPLG